MTNQTISHSSDRKRRSIRTKLQFILVILVVVSTLLVTIAAIRSINQSYRVVNTVLSDALKERYKSTIQREIETMISIFSVYTPNSNLEPVSDAGKNEIRSIVHRAKFNLADNKGEGYFFVYDLNGIVIAHGLDPMLDGKDLSNLKDPKGAPVIKLLMNAAQQPDGGFVEYWWNKPDDLVGRYKKTSYAKMIPNTNWWIGTGIYTDDINRVLQKISDQQKKTLQFLFLKFAILTLVLIIIAISISLYFGAKLSRPIISLSKIAKRISGGDYKTRAAVESHDELGDMAHSFNEMADNINDKMKALEQKERYTSHLLESIGDGLMVTNEKNIIVQVNPAIEKILGYSGNEMIGKNISEFIPKDALEDYNKNVLETVLRGSTFTIYDVIRHKKDGTELRLTITVAPVFEDDQSIHHRIHSVKDMTDEFILRNQIKQMENLKKYFPEQVVEKIVDGAGDVTLELDRKKLTIFFSDLVNFTELSDAMEAEDIVTILREYFTEMGKIVHEHAGTLDKFIGDAVMVFFGAPASNGIKEDAIQCIHMALAMHKKLIELNKKWQLSAVVDMRIGVNTGFVTVGNVGSDTRLEYTVIGTPVNVASRLEHECAPGKILISYETAQLVKDVFKLREMDAIQLKGIHRLVKTYEVLE